MPETDQKPIIFLAFAKQDNTLNRNDLRNLPDEIHGITDALTAAEQNGWCTVLEKTYATTEIIFDVFQKHANRIAVFHFGGHANSFSLLLQDTPAHKRGLVPFLAGQNGLTLVFLNGCSTRQQTHELAAAGIPAVIGTHQVIDDRIAASLAIRFYKGLAAGLILEKAWQDAVNEIKTKNDESASRGFRRRDINDKSAPDGFPWEIEYKKDAAEEIKNWSLPMVARDHPKPPFCYLMKSRKIFILAGILLLLTVAIILLSLGYFTKTKPKPTCPDNSVIVVDTIKYLPANVYWHETGINVETGDCISFSAEGNWYNGISTTGPNGDPKRLCGGECDIVDGNLGELIGKVGDGPPFRIGEDSLIQSIDQRGRLFLSMNENTGACKDGRKLSCFEDNKGVLRVKVKIKRTQSNPIYGAKE